MTSHQRRVQIRQFASEYKPTWRSLFLLLLALLCLGLSYFWAWLLLGVVLITAVTFYLLRADIHQTPGSADFTLTRQHNSQMTLSQPSPVTVTVENLTGQAVDVEVWDATPFWVTALNVRRSPHWSLTLKPHGRAEFPYQIRPIKRGDHAFGDLTLRWTSVWGLFLRQAVYPLPTQVKVYPNLLQIRQYEQLARHGRQIQIGLRQSQQFGSGSEFEQLRDYVPDDDYRRISWKATARHGKPITVDFSPERSQNIVLLVDVGRRMGTRPLGIARTTRLDLVINAVLMFSYVALKRGDRVGMLTFAGQIHHYIPPRSGSNQLLFLVEGLYNVEPQASDPDYGRAFHYLQTQRQRRSLLVLLTDPTRQEAVELLAPQLGAFYPHHLPLCITLSDPNVLAAAQRSPYSMDAIQERALAEQILDERLMWRSLLERRGVMTMDIPAYHLTAGLLNKYLELKGQTRL
ncbi:MAG TPA: DUF58 domain-containing protein [Chloroflexota bacterium]|nr:DUF58 domain-containing protein [Chloroflexota bacterium]